MYICHIHMYVNITCENSSVYVYIVCLRIYIGIDIVAR